MAKKKSFDPDALAKAGQAIVSKHQSREKVTPAPKPKPKPKPSVKKKKPISKKEATQLCRIGLSFHKKAKLAAVRNDMTIRAYLESLIQKDAAK